MVSQGNDAICIHDCDWDGKEDYRCLYHFNLENEMIETIYCEGNYNMKRTERD
jgi:hypothetical protein